MKILFLTNNLQKAGKEKQLFLLMQGLDSREIAFKIIMRFPRVDFPLDEDKVFYISPQGKLKQLRELREIIKAYKPDIIHSWEGYMSLMGRLASIGMKGKFIDGSIRYARKFPWYSIMNIRTKILNIIGNRTVANSRAGLASYGLKENLKNKVIYNGIDLGEVPLIKQSIEEFVVGMVANFTKAKDYKTLVNTGISLLETGFNVSFVFVGDGPEKKKIKEIIPNKYASHFNFKGKVDNPLEYISNFNLGILLNKKGHSEGMSNSIMEYMLLKKPVIATKTGGNPELIDDEKNGFLVPHEDMKLLYEKLAYMIHNPAIASQMGVEGHNKIIKQHKVDNYVANWYNLYSDLLK